MARFVAAKFPELARHLPAERKPWMSEDLRTAIFDAAAFALAFFLASKTSEQYEKTDIGYRPKLVRVLQTVSLNEKGRVRRASGFRKRFG